MFAGQFRVLQPLGAGGMGTVYLVEQVTTGQQRALKVMNANLVDDVRARERFTQEAQMAARIESEHVTQVVAAGIDPERNTPWIALELLRGEDLAQTLARRGRLPLAEVRELLKQLAHALAAAHRLGIVHRDLKPENIYIATSRRSDAAFTVKVLDFGIAKWLQENQPSRTTSVLGSPLWMAPEQFDTARLIAPATDVWALGLVAFTMLTGVSYWRAAQRESVTLPALIAEISLGQLVPASQRAEEAGRPGLLPASFDAWFARCVARDMTERFADAGEALAALERVFAARDSVPPTAMLPGQRPGPLSAMVTPMMGSFGSPAPVTVPDVSRVPSTGTAVMPAMPPGSTPPWMSSVQGAPVLPMPMTAGPFGARPPTTAPRKSSAGKVALAVFLLLVVAGGVAGAVWWSSQCDTGYHDSSGHCCADNATWNAARNACVLSTAPQPAPLAPVVSPPQLTPLAAPLPAPTPLPIPLPTPQPQPVPQPSPPPQPIAPPHACMGSWSGEIGETTGAYGAVRMFVRARAAQCGEWREAWANSGAHCAYRFVNCRFDGAGIRGIGVSDSPRCTTNVTVSVQCRGDVLTFREATDNDVVDTSTMRRVSAE